MIQKLNSVNDKLLIKHPENKFDSKYVISEDNHTVSFRELAKTVMENYGVKLPDN